MEIITCGSLNLSETHHTLSKNVPHPHSILLAESNIIVVNYNNVENQWPSGGALRTTISSLFPGSRLYITVRSADVGLVNRSAS